MGSATSMQNRGRCFMKTGSQRFPGARRPAVAGLIAATGLLLWTTSSARVFAQQTQTAATLTTAEGDWVRTDRHRQWKLRRSRRSGYQGRADP